MKSKTFKGGLIERFSFKLKEQSLAPKKFIVLIHGWLTGFKFSENKGYVFKNIVAIELQRRSLNKNLEVYQVTTASSKIEVQEIEKKALIKASKELKCKNLLVITEDYEGEEKIKRKKAVGAHMLILNIFSFFINLTLL